MKLLVVIVTAVTLMGCKSPAQVVQSFNAKPARTDRPKSLKELKCELDAITCRLGLRYSIDQQSRYNEGKIWVGFAWPRHMSWSSAHATVEQGGVPTYQTSGYPEYFRTKEQAFAGLITLVNTGSPNDMPEHEKSNPEDRLEPSIVGPLNCELAKGCVEPKSGK